MTDRSLSIAEGLANLRAVMEAEQPGSSETGRCMDCGDVFFLVSPDARVGATYGFCSPACYDAYRASLM